MTETPTLHDYQHVAIDHLRNNPRGALWLEMGLGKTAITLSALTPDHLPVLVVAPVRVATDVWPTEASIWRPDLRVAAAVGTPRERAAALASGADIITISRDSLARTPELLVKHPFRTVVLDESSGFKTRGSQRWKSICRVLGLPLVSRSGALPEPKVPHVWQLTGTPSPNGLLDIWPQIYLLDGGARLGRTYSGYQNRYFSPGRQLPNGVISEWNLRPGADTRIHELLDDIVMSMGTEGRIKLPPVTVNEIRTPLPISAKHVYKKMVQDLVADLSLLGGEIHSASNAAVLSSKLSQISAGFLYVDDADLRGGKYADIHSTKIEALREVVEGSLGSPVLVFYRFRAERERIIKALGKQVHTIEEPNIIQRWNRGEIPVLLAHPASAGHGLNLQHGGHTIVWTSPSWSLEEDMQANKRLARQGQKRPVVQHYLIAPGTVDTAVRARLRDKTSVHTALMDHLESVL